MNDKADKARINWDELWRRVLSRTFGVVVILMLLLPMRSNADPKIWVIGGAFAVIVVLLLEKRIDSPNVIPFAALVLVVAALVFLLLTMVDHKDIKHVESLFGILATLAGVAGANLRAGRSERDKPEQR